MISNSSPSAAPDWNVSKPTISCIVCAYNEADKISRILSVISGHPLLSEVIVVNDGSTDETDAVLSTFSNLTVLSYTENRGKTYALSQGIARANGDYVLLLDADLSGVTADDICDLVEPVLAGWADTSLSLRRNSLAIYRMIGLDFVSGERLIPLTLVEPHLNQMAALPRWGGEVFLNRLITSAAVSIAVVRWTGVYNIRKSEKVGWLKGSLEELFMIADVFRVLTPWQVLTQNVQMLRQKVRPPKTYLAGAKPIAARFMARVDPAASWQKSA